MLDALTLDQMRAFVAVAENGSFRAGAASLSRVQSAVSHAINNLENQLAVSLFDRSGHRPSLTPEGHALLADARAILAKADRMRAKARGLGEGVEFGLSIVVDVLFPVATMARALTLMRESYPSVGVRMEVSALGGPLAALRAGRCKLGIMVGEEFRDQRIELEALSSVSLIAVAASAHPLAARSRNGEPIGTLELADHLQIVLEDPTPLTDGRDFGVLSPGTWRVGTQDAKRALILAGLGWGRLPSWAIERDLADGGLVRLGATALGRQGETALAVYLAHRTDEPLGPAARILRQALFQCAELSA